MHEDYLLDNQGRILGAAFVTVHEEPLPKTRALINLGHAYTTRNEPLQALDYLRYGHAIAQALPEGHERDLALQNTISDMSAIYLDLGLYGKASDLLAEGWNYYPGFPGFAINLAKLQLLHAQDYRNAWKNRPRWAWPASRPDREQARNAIELLNAGMDAYQTTYPRFAYASYLYWNKAEAYRFLGECMLAYGQYRIATEMDADLTTPDCS